MTASASSGTHGISPDMLLLHWQGHRRLTRRTIDAFPSDQLFSYSIGGMRSFGVMVMEVIGMAVPLIQGAISGTWNATGDFDVRTKEEVLRRWDENTKEINILWPQIPALRFRETVMANQWEMPVCDAILYAIDNEVHHRAQGFVYLRALDLEPPPFYER